MGRIIKFGVYLIIILIIFAVLPKSILDNIKKFFNWEVFLRTLKTGFNNLIKFIQETTGIDFNQILPSLKKTFGIDLVAIWTAIKNFLANFFSNLASMFR